MKKSELLRALQAEIGRHDFSTFLTEEPSMANGGPGVVTAGCPACKKRINTMSQFIRHINEDVCRPYWTSCQPAKIMKAMLPRIQPINPTRIAAPFDHNDWFFELKHDGFRALAYIEDGQCRLISRKQIVYKRFAALSTAIAALPVKNAIVDGEIVALGTDGRSQFAEPMRRTQVVIFYAFDLLWHDGEDLRQLPLVERKRRLRRLIKGHTGLMFAEQIQGSGVELFQAICARDLEGIVAKHRLGPYEPVPMTWFKVLNPDYTQKRGRREMFDKFREHCIHA